MRWERSLVARRSASTASPAISPQQRSKPPTTVTSTRPTRPEKTNTTSTRQTQSDSHRLRDHHDPSDGNRRLNTRCHLNARQSRTSRFTISDTRPGRPQRGLERRPRSSCRVWGTRPCRRRSARSTPPSRAMPRSQRNSNRSGRSQPRPLRATIPSRREPLNETLPNMCATWPNRSQPAEPRKRRNPCNRRGSEWSGRRESNSRNQLGRLGLYQLSYTRRFFTVAPSLDHITCRDGEIRTRGPRLPKPVRYQAAPRPVVDQVDQGTLPDRGFRPEFGLPAVTGKLPLL